MKFELDKLGGFNEVGGRSIPVGPGGPNHIRKLPKPRVLIVLVLGP